MAWRQSRWIHNLRLSLRAGVFTSVVFTIPFIWKKGRTEEKHDLIWDKYFMGIALLCEKRSKDDDRQVGACVVNEEPRVIGTGYNGMPLHCRDRLMPWKDRWGPNQKNKKKHFYVCHAELNAIVNKDPKSVKDCTVYVTLFPCNECAKIIVKSGIKKIIYLSNEKGEKPEFEASKLMLEEANIECKAFADCFPGGEFPIKISLDLGEDIGLESSKRKIISWEQYFMALAKLSAEVRSRPDAKEGVCIVNEDKRIVGLGYVKTTPISAGIERTGKENLYVSHAPVNAIVSQSPSSLKGSTMYVTHFPCNECAKVIVQSGITKIIHLEDVKGRINAVLEKEGSETKADLVLEAAVRMFDIAHIELVPYKKAGNPENVCIDYSKWSPKEEK